MISSALVPLPEARMAMFFKVGINYFGSKIGSGLLSSKIKIYRDVVNHNETCMK
jgi:hypothetical protein